MYIMLHVEIRTQNRYYLADAAHITLLGDMQLCIIIIIQNAIFGAYVRFSSKIGLT